jgi:hypothetical protein
MSESPRPLGPLILLIVGVLVALAVFWVGFMLAPAAVLLISYLALSAGERARHQRPQSSDPFALPSGSQAQDAEDATTVRAGGQLGARHRNITRREQEPDIEQSDLVEAGTTTSGSRGAQAL